MFNQENCVTLCVCIAGNLIFQSGEFSWIIAVSLFSWQLVMDYYTVRDAKILHGMVRKKLHELVHDFRRVSRSYSRSISESPLHLISFLTVVINLQPGGMEFFFVYNASTLKL